MYQNNEFNKRIYKIYLKYLAIHQCIPTARLGDFPGRLNGAALHGAERALAPTAVIALTRHAARALL